ncbi:tripartite ATP-independent periplasmic transporter DctQ [Alcanivorax balearicus MACL04]|uniref:TRAP transporter small permease protein n=1 Tax=Alloalcanivorax balearicus MACL04 TaxID=1177182 RepID=A0ABT2R4M0_9GAMM|nr:TRAP transporter small permease subunit [Alloalcanivorax balearicus]MCU5784727.1 tripartite ATP-independent periplasmic transporter DctQ [Alloalcanivorax balearicus MACL04]
MIQALSDFLGRLERAVLRALVVLIPVMVLVNVAARAFRAPIFWLDELAVLTMVWLAMIGLSVTLKHRDAVAVTLLTDAVPAAARKGLRLASDLVVLAFAVIFFILCYRWFDPIGLVNSGFDLEAFAAETFNYMYQEPTATLGMAKFWFWLIMPVVAFTASVHALANLLATLRASGADFQQVRSGAEGVD